MPFDFEQEEVNGRTMHKVVEISDSKNATKEKDKPPGTKRKTKKWYLNRKK